MNPETPAAPTSDMVDKIRALLRKAEQAATPEEADAFTAGAAKLMAKYKIDQFVIESAEANAAQKERLNLVKEYYNTGRDKCYTDDQIFWIVRNCFMVKTFQTTTYEPPDYTAYDAAKEVWEKKLAVWEAQKERDWDTRPKRPKFPRAKKRYTYVLVGDKSDVDLAREMIPEFRRIMRHLLKRHLEETGEPWKAEIAVAFYDGFRTAYEEANRQAVKEAALEAGSTAAGQYAIVLASKQEKVEAFAQKTVQTVRARGGSGGGARSGYDYGAYGAGKKSAAGLNLKNRRLG